MYRILIGVSLLSAVSFAQEVSGPMQVDHLLWYAAPASEWTSALPVGNGRLGAMVFGGVRQERIQLNEDTIWAGPPVPVQPADAGEWVRKARELFFAGKPDEGEALVKEHVLAPRIAPRSYQPLGDLNLQLISEAPNDAPVSGYRRELDLDTAVARTTFTLAGVLYTREVFCSRTADVTVVRLTTGRPGALSLDVSLKREADAEAAVSGNSEITLIGQATQKGAHPGVKFGGVARIVAEGGTTAAGNGLISVRNANSVTILIACATDYNAENPAQPLPRDRLAAARTQLDAAAKPKYGDLLGGSISAHQALARRCGLDLGVAQFEVPTDQRLNAVRDGNVDLSLIALYFQYGRYLLICSSRPGGLPANLQGLWNEHIEAPWNADFHTNINLQMNYWPADVANLFDCFEPFTRYIENVRPAGRELAKRLGCKGFAMGHEGDCWLWTACIGEPVWGMWPMGAGWCATQIMDHYRFSRDRDFLAQHAFPLLRECSEFFLDWLVEDPKSHLLVSGPDTSPENSYKWNGQVLSLTMGPSMDQEIIMQVFSDLLEAADELKIKDDLTQRVKDARRKLAKPGSGPDGRLLEWATPLDENEPGHRHMSHLFALHPGNTINHGTLPLFNAARKSLEYRLKSGGGHTGWSRAWIISFMARLGEGFKAGENVQALLAKSTLPNLFDNHPPFQIDGNFGATAGIAEMIVQSDENEVEIFPALPKSWNEGNVHGLRARGGLTIDLIWDNNSLRQAVIHASVAGTFRIRCKQGLTPADNPVVPSPETIDLELKAGQTVTLLSPG